MKTNKTRKFLCVVLAMLLVVAMIPATAFAAEPTYKITLDKVDFDSDGLVVYAYEPGVFDPDMLNTDDKLGSMDDHNDTVDLPKDGVLIALCEVDKFGISAEDATISKIKKLYVEEWGEYCWYYELTNFTKDTVVKVSPFQPAIINSVDVQVDWDNVPQLEKGMTYDDIPSFEEAPAVVTATGINEDHREFGWAIKLNDSCKITAEDSYYNELVNSDEYGIGFIEDFNDEIDENAAMNNGWAPIELMFENPYYEINDVDTYSLYVVMYADAGYTLGNFVDGGYYPGEVTTNASEYSTLVRHITDNSEGIDEGMAVFLKLGTLAEIEAEKGGETPAPETPKTEAPKTEAPKTETPKTGDTNSVLPMVALMALAGVAYVAADKRRKEN